jgi:hypothetical protein
MKFKDLERVCETKLAAKGVWVKAILCKRLWEFATTLLTTWTSMHLECGKRKKMNGK